MFTFNFHALNHLIELIERLSCLRCYSCRPLERKIGYIKRAVKSTKSAGINASNLLEQEQIFHFLRLNKIVDFEAPYQIKKNNTKPTFRYHPKHDPDAENAEETKQYPQQWSPLPPDIPFSDINTKPTTKLQKYDVTYNDLNVAMNDYLARLTGNASKSFDKVHTDQVIQFSERIWRDSMVLSCEAYKQNQKSSRKDCFCYFRSNHKNNRKRTVTNFYFGKIILFLNFDFIGDKKNKTASTYALIEPMSINGTASFDSTIPRVKPYGAAEKKRYVIVDVAEIEATVGLLTDIDCPKAEKYSRREVSSGFERSFKYVILPGRAFPKT